MDPGLRAVGQYRRWRPYFLGTPSEWTHAGPKTNGQPSRRLGSAHGIGVPRLLAYGGLRGAERASVRNFMLSNRPHLIRTKFNDCSGLSIKSDEFDFICRSVLVDEDDCSDVACLKSVLGNRGCQNHPVMFGDHGCILIYSVGCHQSGIWLIFFDNPHGSDHQRPFLRAGKGCFDNVFFPETTFDNGHVVVFGGMQFQGIDQLIGSITRESKRNEENGLGRAFGMFGIEQVCGDLLPRNYCALTIRYSHERCLFLEAN